LPFSSSAPRHTNLPRIANRFAKATANAASRQNHNQLTCFFKHTTNNLPNIGFFLKILNWLVRLPAKKKTQIRNHRCHGTFPARQSILRLLVLFMRFYIAMDGCRDFLLVVDNLI
jgi:hypothetical protein